MDDKHLVNPSLREQFHSILSYYMHRSYKRVVETAESLLSSKPEDLVTMNLKARALLQLERLAEAAQCVEEIIELDLDNSDGWGIRGKIEARCGSYEKAREYLDKSLDLDSRNTHSLLAKGILLARVGCLDEAITYFDRAITADLDLKEVWKAKDEKIKEEGVYKEYTHEYNAARNVISLINARLRNARMWKGDCLARQKRYEEALQYIEEACGFSKRNPILYIKGCVLFKLGKHDEARACFMEAREKDIYNDHMILSERNSVHSVYYEEALACLRGLLETNSGDSTIWFAASHVFSLLCRDDKVLKSVDMALGIPSRCLNRHSEEYSKHAAESWDVSLLARITWPEGYPEPAGYPEESTSPGNDEHHDSHDSKLQDKDTGTPDFEADDDELVRRIEALVDIIKSGDTDRSPDYHYRCWNICQALAGERRYPSDVGPDLYERTGSEDLRQKALNFLDHLNEALEKDIKTRQAHNRKVPAGLPRLSNCGNLIIQDLVTAVKHKLLGREEKYRIWRDLAEFNLKRL